MTDPGLDTALIATIDDVLRGVGRRRTGTIERVSSGVLNENFRVESDRGLVFVRRMRPDVTPDRARDEHRLIAWVRERGGPATEPLKDASGDTVQTIVGAVWAVFPWIEGSAPARGTLSDRQVRSLGEAHGLLDRILATHPDSAQAAPPPAWDAATSIEDLLLCIEAARERGTHDPIVEAMEHQVQLLERELLRPPHDVSGLHTQLVHGDFHDQQAIFGDDGRVVAITDWELFRPALRIRQVLRSLAFSQLLHTPRAGPYLEGYCQQVRLPEAEMRAGVRLWRIDRIYATWLYHTCFIDGNERAGELLAGAAEEAWSLDDDTAWHALEERLAGFVAG